MKIPFHIELADIPNKGKGIVAKKYIKKNTTVLKFDEGITIRPNSTASSTAIQIDEDTFLDSKPTQIRDFLNHSCEPNIKIDFDEMGAIAIHDIKQSEEITFCYNTTEYDLAVKNEEFQCFCNSKECIGTIKGFLHLKKEHQKKLGSLLSPFLLRKSH
ncbi:MAG: SET domain-containing protein-lysine N-methyltransferase [Nitrosopumilus sp.]|nr:SET domain-containing protein-lysine N-methyltransferase [Nitrosopumilus sp.]MDH3487642.1 SET domain-containing protein-lysine N-methyltransferase [Nitrosopumilus sp.]